MLVSTPICGCSRTSQISEATATDVATVDEYTVRKKRIPRRCLSASTARPSPITRPAGTVMSAKRKVTPREWRNSLDCNTSQYCCAPTYVFSPPNPPPR